MSNKAQTSEAMQRMVRFLQTSAMLSAEKKVKADRNHSWCEAGFHAGASSAICQITTQLTGLGLISDKEAQSIRDAEQVREVL